ncbi:biotin--[acetyl-CoA-carboxylase] ligase [Candidatus Deianiraea vastatrix]|uniref:Bifunctional ligase/repressor BirA n=1 Tax=Candidatus Deianiraea vastatrix TaxID=2163644 RepID=A0A5B8XDK0_9RICK|nr:biotin--[acetyl-CoA-carboxylase] ligase [Candidatus Deianiraea vastatrix]QED23343.1 Bifunctional ligase/repressor BirA [Candidatus Deianiraea vastatrix]
MDIIFHDEINSTQTLAKQMLQDGKISKNTLIYTQNQTSGFGRKNNAWHHSKGNLAMSFIVKIDELPYPYSIICGYIVANVLEKYNIDVKIKWPNDLMLNDGKLGGIITTIENYGNNKYCIFGIGINLVANPDISEYKTVNIKNICKKEINFQDLAKEISENIYNAINLNQLNNIIQNINNIAYKIGEKCEYMNNIYTFLKIATNGNAILIDKLDKEVIVAETQNSINFNI